MHRNASCHRLHPLAVLVVVMAGCSCCATTGSTQDSTAPLRRHGLIIVGLAGDSEHQARFEGVVKQLSQWLIEDVGVASESLTVLQSDLSNDADLSNEASRLATQANLRSVIASISETIAADDGLWVLTIGHGSQDDRDGFFHLPGPDLNAEQWAGLFADLKAKEQVLILTHSASGRFIKPFSLPGRVVITATDDGEINEARFSNAMAHVIDRSDTEQRTSNLLQFFLQVHRQVARSYDEDHLLPTEHALLDDNGDGVGSESHALESVAAEESAAAAASLLIDGMLARQILFTTQPSASTIAKPSAEIQPDIKSETQAAPQPAPQPATSPDL